MTCVRCAGPEQTYRCQASASDAVPSEALRIFCMSRIAREHAHQSCGVVRSAADCNGIAVSYAYEGEGTPPAQDQAAPEREPKTLAEITRNSVSVSKAGKAIGDATERTLKCLGSALKSC